MEGATATVWTGIKEGVTEMVGLTGTLSNAMLDNKIFVITLAVVFFGIGLGVVFTLLRKAKRKGR